MREHWLIGLSHMVESPILPWKMLNNPGLNLGFYSNFDGGPSKCRRSTAEVFPPRLELKPRFKPGLCSTAILPLLLHKLIYLFDYLVVFNLMLKVISLQQCDPINYLNCTTVAWIVFLMRKTLSIFINPPNIKWE